MQRLRIPSGHYFPSVPPRFSSFSTFPAACRGWASPTVIKQLQFPSRLLISLFSGRPQGLDIAISARDDEAASVAQWDRLRALFVREDTVLIFHLTNHYALLYAMRETCPATAAGGGGGGGGGGTRREVRHCV